MKIYQRYAVFCTVLLSALAPVHVLAQAVGSIAGTVSDATGAVVAQAKVTATREETGVAQSTVTSGAGTFTIPNLPVGTYTVDVNATGFTTKSITGITLDVSQQRDVNFTVAPEGAVQTTTVSAAAPLMNTSDATLAGLVDQKQVETLPLNGRSIQNLVMLQPGMAQDTGTMGWLAPQWIGNGNRGESSVASLDGADATDSEMGTIQFWNFNLDAIAEFKVLQSNYSAEFGQGGGTVTQMVSKSGTNRFHGSAYEFIRNSWFDASNYFSNTGVSPFQRNEFGATIGGPIIKGRTFFFGEWAALRQRLGEPTPMNVPTAGERNGLITVTGYDDPSTNDVGYDGYQYKVPLNSVAAGVMAKYPLPNQPNGVFGENTYNAIFKQPTDMNQYSVRIDHKISDKDSLFGRASYVNNEEKYTDAIAALEDPAFSSTNINDPRNFAISETHIVSPSLLNTLLFSLNRQIEGVTPQTQEYTQTTAGDGSFSNYGPDTFITKYVETYYNAIDKVNWNIGRHSIDTGIEYRYGQDNGFGVTSAGPNGAYSFNKGTAVPEDIYSTDGGKTITTTGRGSPSGLISLMLGKATNYNRSTSIPGFAPPGGGEPKWGLRDWHMAAFIQDDIRFTPKLTANLGLRYEYNSVPYEIENRLGGIADSGPQYGHFLLNPEPLYPSDKKGFGPRVGANYQLTPRTVLRGGFAIFTNLIPTVYPDQAAVLFPLASFSSLTNPPYSLTPLPVSLPPVMSTTGQVMPPAGGPKKIPANTPVNLANIAAVTGLIGGDWPSMHLRNGYTMSGNVSLDQQLPGDMALQMTFVTNDGMNMWNSEYPNAYTYAQPSEQPFTAVTPGLGELQMFYNDGKSRYNALHLQVRKISPLHGLQYQANYTWGKVLTNADDVWAAPGSSGGVTLNDPKCVDCEYARASYDLRQRFVANFSYEIPDQWGFVPGAISKGWQALGIYSAQSGTPFTITSGFGTLQYGVDTFNGAGTRPNFIKWAPRDPQHRAQFFPLSVTQNQNAYWSIPQSNSSILNGTVQTAPGNLGRNTYTGPGFWNFDYSMLKNTQLTEGLNVQFRAEFFNVFNHPQFANPGGTLGTGGSFGQITSTVSSTAEREMQFGLRFEF